MVFKKILTVPKDQTDYIERLLTVEPKSREDCFGEDSVISVTAVFEDGIEMDIKVCGVQFEEGESNLPWTEAVLFKNGCECGCPDPCDEFFGEWEFTNDVNTYIAVVVKE